MKALVTGATGFLGSRLVELLVQRGATVTALARPTSDTSCLTRLPLHVARGTLEDVASLVRAVRGQDVVFHCAGRCSDWGSWSEFHSANVSGVRGLLEAMRSVSDVRRLVHVSSTDVYGFPARPTDEDAPLAEVGPAYVRSKALGERQALELGAKAGISVTVLRPATIYGPRCPIWVLELVELLRAGRMLLINQGRSPAGLIYVDDVVAAMLRVVDQPQTSGRSYNIVNDEVVTWREYVHELASAVAAEPPTWSCPAWLATLVASVAELAYVAVSSTHRPLLTRHAVLLCSRSQQFPTLRAQRDFGFEPAVTFAEGMLRVERWWAQRSVALPPQRPGEPDQHDAPLLGRGGEVP